MKPRSRLRLIHNWRELARKANYHAASLAKLCRVSTRTLRRFFREYRRMSLRAWLGNQICDQAKQLIRQGERIKEVARDLGYNQTPQFCRHFKVTLGISPKAWRKTLRNIPAAKSKATRKANKKPGRKC
jgi:AraC-like DNA-binding protein